MRMRILQPAEWSKPRGFSHGVEVDGPGKWIVLAGQTGGDEKGDYAPDMAAQVGTALKRIIKLLGEAGAGPEHIVRLTWYLTSRSEYEAAGAGIGAAWRETLGRNFPPSTLLYIDGLVDVRAKVILSDLAADQSVGEEAFARGAIGGAVASDCEVNIRRALHSRRYCNKHQGGRNEIIFAPDAPRSSEGYRY